MLRSNMADISTKQGGWAGLNLSRQGRGGGSPSNCGITLLTYKYICSILDFKSRHHPTHPRRNPKTQGSPPDPTRGLNAPAHPAFAAQAKDAISSPHRVPVPPSLTIQAMEGPYNLYGASSLKDMPSTRIPQEPRLCHRH